jgi:hypothetical protein
MPSVQRHEATFVVDAPPHRVWRVFHPKTPPDAVVPRTFEHPGGTITILRDGDDDGAGLVRECTFGVPRWLLSGGVARSFECVVEARRNEFSRYEAVGKPLWSKATGWHTLEPVDGGERTQLTFAETYHAYGPVVRRLFEARVHRFISRSNSAIIESVLQRVGGRPA